MFPTHPLELRRAIDEQLQRLLSHAYRLCRSRPEAEDLVQDTIERALRFEDTYEPGSNLRAWLHQILFSVFMTRCRRAAREKTALECLKVDPCAWTRVEPEPDMLSLSVPIERALGALPGQYRTVVELVDVQERSYKEAANLLRVPVGTVMSRLFRGRRLLAESLQDPSAAECEAA